MSSKGYVRPRQVRYCAVHGRVVLFILLQHVHAIENIINLWVDEILPRRVLFMVLQSWTK